MVLVKTMFIRSPREFGAWLSTALPLVFIVVNNSESCGKFICLLRSKFIAFDQGTSGRPVSVLTCVKTNLFSDFLENEIFNFGSYRKFYAFILTSSLLTC